MRLLVKNHGVSLEVGLSQQPIPVHFALSDEVVLDASFDEQLGRDLIDHFDLPDLAAMDDTIANGISPAGPYATQPLALFTAPRVDYSLHRLRHYTGTSPGHFQNFVLFTNYQFYIDEFIRIGREPAGEHPLAAGSGRVRARTTMSPSSSRATASPGTRIIAASSRRGRRPPRARRRNGCRRCPPITCSGRTAAASPW
jgi:AMP nucleosidase